MLFCLPSDMCEYTCGAAVAVVTVSGFLASPPHSITINSIRYVGTSALYIMPVIVKQRFRLLLI